MTIKTWSKQGPSWDPSYISGKKQSFAGYRLGDSGNMVTFGNNIRDLGRGDVGSPWLLEKLTRSYVDGYAEIGNYRGPTCANFQPPIRYDPLPAKAHDSDYYADGARAIASTEPTNPVFSASTAMGEALQDGLPALVGVQTWEAKTLRAKQAGGEYLNYQFGWVPFVSDLRTFAYAVSNSTEIVHNYRHNADKKIHRRFQIRDDIPRQDTYSYTGAIKTPWNTNIGSELQRVTVTHRDREWFSGCFTYHIPVGNAPGARLDRYRSLAHKLLGVDITPETVWNIAPWSWAVDWKTDVGDVIHNASAIGHNGLVLQYGYVMHELERSFSVAAAHGMWSETVSRKRRVAANPYGFGVSTSGLSVQQLAILAALGLNRGDARICY